MSVRAKAGQVVIVDDDPHVLNALRFAFEVEGHDVRTYGAGEDLLTAGPGDASCIIIDERLPGMSGAQTIALLRSRGVQAPAVLITTRPSQALVARARAVGAEIVEKPLIGDELTLKVEQMLSANPV